MVIINAHSFDQKGISESIQQRITFAVIAYCCQQMPLQATLKLTSKAEDGLRGRVITLR